MSLLHCVKTAKRIKRLYSSASNSTVAVLVYETTLQNSDQLLQRNVKMQVCGKQESYILQSDRAFILQYRDMGYTPYLIEMERWC